MTTVFSGSDALRRGDLTAYQLRNRFEAIHRDVYLPRETELTAALRAKAAWLWSGRAGVVAGQSAAALHGARWVDANAPAELLYANRRPPAGIRAWSDRYDDDEVEVSGGVVVTTPERTALDIACRYPLDRAVAAIDALARATTGSMPRKAELIEPCTTAPRVGGTEAAGLPVAPCQ